MPIAREQLSASVLNDRECPESVILQLENPVRIIERSGSLQERHWLELHLLILLDASSIPSRKTGENLCCGKVS